MNKHLLRPTWGALYLLGITFVVALFVCIRLKSLASMTEREHHLLLIGITLILFYSMTQWVRRNEAALLYEEPHQIMEESPTPSPKLISISHGEHFNGK